MALFYLSLNASIWSCARAKIRTFPVAELFGAGQIRNFLRRSAPQLGDGARTGVCLGHARPAQISNLPIVIAE